MKAGIDTTDFLVKEENMVTSTDGVNIKGGRRFGNTTRIIDNTIQQLFDGKKVAIKDYPDSGKLHDTERLAQRIMSRIISEHKNIEYSRIHKEYKGHLLFMWFEK